MQKTNNKKYIVHLTAVLLSVAFVGVYYYFTRAVSSNQVQFTADTNLSLSGVSDGDLQISNGSECASLSISGAGFTASGITDGGLFVLKTPSYSNSIKIQPSGNTADLTVSSANLSSGIFSRWTLSSTGVVTITQAIGVPSTGTKYDVNIDGQLYNSYTSNSSKEISFNYTGSGSKVFSVAESASQGSVVTGGIPFIYLNPPKPPAASPANPGGDFQIIIPEEKPVAKDGEQTQTGKIAGISTTTNRVITLKLLAGPNVKKMAISEDPNFKNANIIPYQETYKWTLSKGLGQKTIYVKFFTEFGVPSKVISINVSLIQSKKTASSPVELAPIKPEQTGTTVAPSKTPSVKFAPMPSKKKSNVTEKKIGMTTNGHLIYKGLAGTYYGYLSERAVQRVKTIIQGVKTSAIDSFNIFAEQVDKITPKFIKNAVNAVQTGYSLVVNKVKYEILRFILK